MLIFRSRRYAFVRERRIICTPCELPVDVRRFARERRPRPEAADKAITLVFELSVASLKI